MNITDEIIAARNCGVVHCGFSSLVSPSLAELASQFGLSADPANYREIDEASARWLIEMVLNQDMAYNAEILPADRAVELADRFLSPFRAQEVRFFTNGSFHEARGPKLTWSGASWNPATQATFDTGVMILGPKFSACLWVEDED